MPTQRGGYFNSAGQRVPSVTTVIGQNCGWSKRGLMIWAYKQGQRPENKDKKLDDITQDADIGTQAHAMVELHIQGITFNPEDFHPKALAAYLEYVEWQRRSRLVMYAVEVPLVSDKFDFGGTIDAIAICEDRYELIDWKTSKAVYEDYLVQLAAYLMLWNERHPHKQIERLHLARFGKHGGFHHHSWPPSIVAPCQDAFRYLLELHHIKGEIKAVL